MNAIRKFYEEKKQALISVGRMCAVGVVGVAANSAFAAGPDYSTLTAAADFTTAIAAILAVFAAVAGLVIVMRGGRLVISVIKR